MTAFSFWGEQYLKALNKKTDLFYFFVKLTDSVKQVVLQQFSHALLGLFLQALWNPLSLGHK